MLNTNEINTLLEYFPKGVVFFDLEMTGLSAVVDKIIEIGAVRIKRDGTVSEFHSLVNPLVSLTPENSSIHGLTNDDLREAPTLKSPLKEFMSFVGSLPLLAHNAQFDASFIIRAHHELYLKIPNLDVFDSCKVARKAYKEADPAPKDYKLQTLSKFFNLSTQNHRALDDAKIGLKTMALILAQNKVTLPNYSELKKTSYIFNLSKFQKAESYILNKKFLPLAKMARKQEKILLTYKGGSRSGEKRPVKAIAIVPLPSGLSLYGFCELDDKFKFFKLKKITDFETA